MEPHGSQQALHLPSCRLRCALRSEGFTAIELRCGLFGCDLELLDANECPESLGRSAVLAKGEARRGKATVDSEAELTLELQLEELPSSVQHLVLASVGRTHGGWLYLSIQAGRFQQQYSRSQFPEHGSTYAQGSMLAVLSRMSRGWLLQEVVPNIGLSCEQQDATVRELYWPEVGVAIERTAEAGSVTWLEVFRAYPEACSSSDDETCETRTVASLPSVWDGLPFEARAASIESQPDLATPVLSSQGTEMEKGSSGSGRSHCAEHSCGIECQPASAKQTPEVRDFGPPRATQGASGTKHAAPLSESSRSEMAELCQEAGRLSVSLGLSEDRLSKSEAMASKLLGEVRRLEEQQRSFSEDARLKSSQIASLRSELQDASAELARRRTDSQAQRDEFEHSMTKAASKQERYKGELAAMKQELQRVSQQLAQEKLSSERDKGALRTALQEAQTEATAARKAEGSWRYAHDELTQRLSEQEATTRAGVFEAQSAGSNPVDGLYTELSEVQASFAQELGDARARLAVAESRNKELLESLQKTMRAHMPQSFNRPASLPAPPTALPMCRANNVKGSDTEGLLASSERKADAEPGLLLHPAWSHQRQEAERQLWEMHCQQHDRAEQLMRQQQELQRQQLHMHQPASQRQSELMLSGSTTSSRSFGSQTVRELGRLPSAPNSDSGVETEPGPGEAVRRAAERRRAQGKATRTLDDEYARFVQEAHAPKTLVKSTQSARIGEHKRFKESMAAQAHAYGTEPYVLNDLCA